MRRSGLVQGQLNLFASQEDQIRAVAEASPPTAFTPAVTQEEIDLFLRLGGNTENVSRLVSAAFKERKPLSEIAAVLRENYQGGFGLRTAAGDASCWASADGIYMARGHEARYVPTAQVLFWEDAARRIGKLLDAGQYVTDADLVQTSGEDLTETVRSLWELYKSLPDGVAAAGNLQFLTQYQGKRYAETIANLAVALENTESKEHITAVYRRFLDEWTADKTAPPLDESLQASEILRQLEDNSPPRRMPRNALPEQVSFFITDDEIQDALCGNLPAQPIPSGTMPGWNRICPSALWP